MSYAVRYTRGARDDLLHLYQFQLERDIDVAERALEAIREGTRVLKSFPFTCRKADEQDPFLRELLVSFGSSGYVVLFEVEDDTTVSILASRPQIEEDYH
ncbi:MULTISPECIES: type II toxin-antitoxin system RelE/ParE family toxin [unclassified Caballeronia]|uniref:type II toxin-antitoxin system RelE/ParE family toxin n=1 Tax=unclassified Caballeronia TaxID=2646786 RepID=UPI0028635CBC|nr:MULTISPECIES: type II toxin-antitoxin system RelE/ParE family toxin [unclassified Caballeronia]MDR5738963.1 type II toxin-antitoxin system RelE/ParE family toxin [Caballeronia sp. LZ016]MDR5807451.1 type II toxin-antitoxin system RelE/ParE family toxin [Caballeronia sp. LZ019]